MTFSLFYSPFTIQLTLYLQGETLESFKKNDRRVYPKLKTVGVGRGVIKCSLHVGTENTTGCNPLLPVDEPPQQVAQPCTVFQPKRFGIQSQNK